MCVVIVGTSAMDSASVSTCGMLTTVFTLPVKSPYRLVAVSLAKPMACRRFITSMVSVMPTSGIIEAPIVMGTAIASSARIMVPGVSCPSPVCSACASAHFRRLRSSRPKRSLRSAT